MNTLQIASNDQVTDPSLVVFKYLWDFSLFRSSISYCLIASHLDFRAGGDDDDLSVRQPILGAPDAVALHVVERLRLVVPGDGVRRAVAVLLSAVVMN